MDYNRDKVDDVALALLHLTSFGDRGLVRAWKASRFGRLESSNYCDAKIKVILGTVLLSLALAAVANAQDNRWRSLKTQKLITFDFNCAQKDSFPADVLGKIVQSAIKPEFRGGPTTYGDQAFATTLQVHGATVYFVPTVCGATGNCTWRLYTIKPMKYLGEINGQFIYTYQSSRDLPIIVTYGHISASEGGLSTYVANKGKYRPLRGEYSIDAQGVKGHPMPKFLEAAKPQCKDYGS